MLATPDQQISLTDHNFRSMVTRGRDSGVVGYNVQAALDTTQHLIITHEVTNVGTDRSQLASVAKEAKATLETVEHPFGTIRARMRATHFLMKTLSRVATSRA